jgi:hypothetical protein
MKKFFAGIIATFAIGISIAQAYTTYTVNGVPYLFPDVDDEEWGQYVTNWAGGVSNGTFQKTGGTFALTSEANFGSIFGLRAPYFKSKNLPAASTGEIRLANTDTIRWRNMDNTGDFTFSVNGASLPVFNGYVLGYSTDLVNVIFLATSTLQTYVDAQFDQIILSTQATYVRLEEIAISTTYLAVTGGSTNFIHNQSYLQDGSTFFVSEAYVAGKIAVGSMTVYGTITTTSAIVASSFFGSGANLTDVMTLDGSTQTKLGGATFSGSVFIGNRLDLGVGSSGSRMWIQQGDLVMGGGSFRANTGGIFTVGDSKICDINLVGGVTYYVDPTAFPSNIYWLNKARTVPYNFMMTDGGVFFARTGVQTVLSSAATADINSLTVNSSFTSKVPLHINDGAAGVNYLHLSGAGAGGSMIEGYQSNSLRFRIWDTVDKYNWFAEQTILGSSVPVNVANNALETVGSVKIRGNGSLTVESGDLNLQSGKIDATSNITTSGGRFVGNGSGLTNISGSALNGGSTSYASAEAVVTATANITARADAVAIATTNVGVAQISIYNAGAFVGNVSSINFNTNLTATVTGGTATVNATAGGGGSGTSVYTITIGTDAFRGANYVGNNQSVFNSAITAGLALIVNTTDQVTIFVQRGSYTISSEVFVPARITIEGEDQSAIVSNVNTTGLFYIEGRVTNMGFNIQNYAYTGSGDDRIIKMGFKGIFDYNRFYATAWGTGGGVTVNSVFSLNGSSLSLIDNNRFEKARETGSAFFAIRGFASSNTISNNYYSYDGATSLAQGGNLVFIYSGINNDINHNTFIAARTNIIQCAPIAGSGKVTFRFTDNYLSLDTSQSDSSSFGLIQGGSSAGDTLSTGTVISRNFFYSRGGTATYYFLQFGTATGDAIGVVVDGNIFVCYPPTLMAGFLSQVKRVIFTNNQMFGTSAFISDSGANTLYTGRNNQWNGILQ